MKVLVVSAHPDDEVIGAGGTLLKHVNSGDQIYWLIVTEMKEEQGYSSDKITKRKTEIDKINKALQISTLYTLEYPTTSLSNALLPEMIPQISRIISQIAPEIIYLPNHTDIHSDHRITFEAVISCTKSFRQASIKKILMYECISETEFAPAFSENAFMPNYFVDISEYFNTKIELLNIYSSEIGEHPFPRSIRNTEALAVFRGATAGVEYAEAFQLVKFIDK